MTNKQIDDGGTAFPTSDSNYYNENVRSEGMTIRDYFAARSIDPAVFQFPEDRLDYFKNAATCAYMMADAMLAERAKEGSQ